MIRILLILLFAVVGCNGGDDEWPPDCGMSSDDFERHMEIAHRLASGVRPSDVYDFNGNGAVDADDLGRLRSATADCK